MPGDPRAEQHQSGGKQDTGGALALAGGIWGCHSLSLERDGREGKPSPTPIPFALSLSKGGYPLGESLAARLPSTSSGRTVIVDRECIMKLIGQYDSPFVRRVAVALKT